MQKKPSLLKLENTLEPKQVSRYYTDCKELPLYNFLKVLTEEDYSFLVIEGNPSQEELQDTWEIIYNQYSDLYQDRQKSYVFEVVKEVTVINVRLDLIQKMVSFLNREPNTVIEDILRSMGFFFNFDHNDEVSYRKDLSRVISRSKALLMKLESGNKELESLNKGKSTSKTNYDAVLVTLGKYQGYRIDPKTTPVSEYVEVFNQYNKMLEAQEQNGSIPG